KGMAEEKLGYRERSQQSFDKSDKLTGYDPQKSAESLPPIDTNSSNEPSQPFALQEESKKVSSGDFWNTLKSLIADPKTRKEFGKFLKGFFSGKNPKDS